MFRFSHLASLLSLASVGYAGTPIPAIIPFAVIGGLDSCTVTTANKYNSGGFISVNGFSIQVPENLIAQFPVAWVPFPEMCGAGAGGYEVSVTGNVVNGQAIAAQIGVAAQFSLEASQGYIDAVNIADGSIKIRGGPTVRINDPEGIFGKVNTVAPLFTADTENPSVSAFSGFPMCIPRSDADDKCPQSNRPDGATNFAAPDPLAMVPFRVGDFIEYSGLKLGAEILAYAITAINVQVTTTASSTVPNYIRVEDALIGVFDSAANVEMADIRFIGYLSSCTGASVTISAIDVDPCTGEETYRQIGTATPRAGDVRCKWEFRADTTAQSTYTREYMIKANNPVIETKDGILAGQYIQPVTEWIQPEVDIPGTEPPPSKFSDIRGLVQGDFLDGKQYGPLSPFPGPTPPAPSKTCETTVPTNPSSSDPVAAAAPIAAVQRVGATILLAGSNTAQGIPSSDLAFAWTKTSPASPLISIQSASSPTATFVAPQVAAETSFVFEVKVSLKSNSTKSSTASVTVKVSPTATDVVKVTSYTWESRQSGTISVSCSSNVGNGDNTRMSLLLNNGATTINMLSGGSPGLWTYNSRSVSRPTNVQCLSNLGGRSDLVTATTARRRRRGMLGSDAELMSKAEWM
ncbi:hypothetical protein K505DRAFT_298215 [Melanomma pulvis-pyrius CBS 109.77]|uniref:Uncharacterized protein n=1 Tax=Melanomma pulvis-pyrius CBS 109.77 TaxID=1314802 RepID=A0A6A6XPV6_9PLEO|nr:hypothetical protein K505DRAFT_298215 [Melanomma pulvis-pyrius CBS 109.77]